VLGRCARGIEEHFDARGQVDILMGCLSKTLPAQGGYVAGSNDLVKYLRYHARGFVFSAALAPAAAAAALAGLELIAREGETRRAQLMGNVRYFIGRLRQEGFDVGASATAIVPILLGHETLAFEMARHCNLAGLFAMPVVRPAVPAGTERLRMNVTCDHRRADLDLALDILLRARAATALAAMPEQRAVNMQ
jgi:glycine C-acetyltransferase